MRRSSSTKAVDDHGDKIRDGIDKAGDVIDKKTQGKYTDKIARSKTAADRCAGQARRQEDEPRRTQRHRPVRRADPVSDTREPHIDPPPPEGPGGPDSVPDWEAAEPDPPVPDQPLSAQIEDVPDELEQPEDLDEADGAGSRDAKDPADEGHESLTEPAENDEEQRPEEPA